MSNWTPVSKRMPDDDETVMVFDAAASEPVWFGYRDGKDWRYIDGVVAEGITHWMPIPEGPK